MYYELSHLTQDACQAVAGPIQDDEALLLLAVCRVTCSRRILEFGGQSGYSARNFLAAINGMPDGIVYTVDSSFVPRLTPAHRPIQKLAKDVVPADVDNEKLDLVFFDCHDVAQQLLAFHELSQGCVLTSETIIALHDTGTHPQKFMPWAYRGSDGYIHQPAERELANRLQDIGYECVSFHAPKPLSPVQYRHGLTFCLPKRRFDNSRLD
jgi:predicted O-methyltransferase YrrM